MLIEIWERLRGYDKWIQTEATITASDLTEEEVRTVHSEVGGDEAMTEWRSTCNIAWTDMFRTPHSAAYIVSEGSPLFELFEGQTVTIRYNPAYPAQYYLRAELRSKVASTIKWTVIPTLIGFLAWLMKIVLKDLFLLHWP